MLLDLTTHEEFLGFIQKNKIASVYFSTPDCSVCKALKPKIINMLSDDFLKIPIAYINCDENKITAAQNFVFTVPTLVVFVGGKEVLRKSRNISLTQIFH
ncbi:MAG: Thiol-disulfide isomerase/thioredoxin-like protein [Ignavibacteria bacterium]|nr:MAG: Thiol-disulfide isomerase/thioredoxin-like protein [Ignavibacteria bacterium]KAF0159120.1 MAG: Thiol-disulfide isomerase/thioredoxin-like protein [Ignavibacteria bacterium]